MSNHFKMLNNKYQSQILIWVLFRHLERLSLFYQSRQQVKFNLFYRFDVIRWQNRTVNACKSSILLFIKFMSLCSSWTMQKLFFGRYIPKGGSGRQNKSYLRWLIDHCKEVIFMQIDWLFQNGLSWKWLGYSLRISSALPTTPFVYDCERQRRM